MKFHLFTGFINKFLKTSLISEKKNQNYFWKLICHFIDVCVHIYGQFIVINYFTLNNTDKSLKEKNDNSNL